MQTLVKVYEYNRNMIENFLMAFLHILHYIFDIDHDRFVNRSVALSL